MNETHHLMPLFGRDAGSWRARHSHLFPSNESLRHFFRTHRAELVKRGAVVLHRGRWMATQKLTPAVLEIARRSARVAAAAGRYDAA